LIVDPERIQIFRNCGYSLVIPMLDDQLFPIPLAGYNFGMSIAATPVPPSGAFGEPVLQSYFAGSGSGSVTFAFAAEATAELMVGTAYEYRAMGQAPSQEPAVLQYGSVQLIDAPAWPGPMPYTSLPSESETG
jgi:hypothetical protein